MIFDVRSGGLPLVTLILCVLVMVTGGIGFIYVVSTFDIRVANVSNDSVNLTGINYNSEQFNMTNETIHAVAKDVIPNYIFMVIIFIIIAIFTIMAMVLRR